jgi:hypothetical protein
MDEIAPLPDGEDSDQSDGEGAVTRRPVKTDDLVPVDQWMPSFAGAGE